MDVLDRLSSLHNINKPNDVDTLSGVTSHEDCKGQNDNVTSPDDCKGHNDDVTSYKNCQQQNDSVLDDLSQEHINSVVNSDQTIPNENTIPLNDELYQCDGQTLDSNKECLEDIYEDENEKVNSGDEKEMPAFENCLSAEEDLIQFWSPSLKTKIKARFQPKRKSTSRKVDYSDKKKRKRKSGRFLSKKLKKDDAAKKATVARVKRRSVLEINKMKQLRKQTREHRLRNEKNMKLALMSGGYVPVRSVEVTKPKEFNFSIVNRGKLVGRPMSEKKFESGLRNDSTVQGFKNESTIPVPFKFKLSQKTNENTEKWESFSQAAMKFQTRTPTRYRVKPSEEDKSFLERKTEKKEPHITMPITPKLLTRGRSRRYKIENAKELEEKEIEEMRNYKFKATELNPKILEKKGMYGVKSVPVSSTTEPKPFNFEIEQRICNRTCKDVTLLEEDTTIQNKTKLSSSEKLKPTQPKPFSFQEKDKVRYMKKEEKIKQQILEEKKMHEFQASLLPSFTPDRLPSVQTKRQTRQKPFNISSGSLSYQTKLDVTMRMEQTEEQERRQFKAQPADVIKKQPFQPATGLIPPTKISKLALNTDARADERELRQYWKQQKENMIEEERARLEKEKKLVEEAEVKKLRKKAVHKAKPVPNFRPMKIKKSDIPPTIPETPNFQVEKRVLARVGNSRRAKK